MNGADVLKASYAMAHQMAGFIAGDLAADAAGKTLPGSNVQPMGHILVHAIGTEDRFIQGMMQHKPLVFETGGWAEKLGFQPGGPPSLTDDFNVDPAKVMAYGQAVFAAAEAYVGGLSDAELAREFDTGILGVQKIGQFLGGLALSHFTAHLGEIAALKGAMGLKGLPF